MNDNDSKIKTSEDALLNQSSGLSKSKIFFEKFSSAIARGTGRPAAFMIALLMVVVWGASGPLFHFSETWQLVINTSTTIITFLMVFLIQHAQNKDTVALHLKLNELISANRRANNKLINIEDLTEEELDSLKNFFVNLSTRKDDDENPISHKNIDKEQLAEAIETIKSQIDPSENDIKKS